MRPGFLTFNDPRGSGLRHYPADTHLLAWLEAKGIAFDIVTDEDLDDEGAALLAPYRAVLTGSHPEYHTLGTLDALHGLHATAAGGSPISAATASTGASRACPSYAQHRSSCAAPRAASAPGPPSPANTTTSSTAQYGGLWRRNRRPPQMLVGVGFSGQGAFEGTYYRRLPASHDPRYAWMFEGIEGDIIGDYGLSGGGAAGFELDRADPVLGTPAGTVILARSENPAAVVRHRAGGTALAHATVTGEEPDATDARRNRVFRHGRPAARCSRSARSPSAAACGTGQPRLQRAQSLACWRTSFANSRRKDDTRPRQFRASPAHS